MKKELSQTELESLFSDPEALNEWKRANKSQLEDVLRNHGGTPEEIATLLGYADKSGQQAQHEAAKIQGSRGRAKFSELKEAKPTPMTDAEYSNILRGRRRDGTD